MLNLEEEINFAIPTPGEMTEEDLERNEMEITRKKEQEDQPQQGEDPTSKLGGKP